MTEDTNVLEIAPTRKSILEACRFLGVERVVVSYSGYGDSGGIEGCELFRKEEPFVMAPPSLGHAATDWAVEVIWAEVGGFENNEGGSGELQWDILADKIVLEHGDNEVVTNYQTIEIDPQDKDEEDE